MNWLAHAFLSPEAGDFRLGNLLADMVRGADRLEMSEAFRRGAACHQRIDLFTDAHEIVRRSRERVAPVNRRFAGILVDIFYDHFLARDWQLYCDETLRDFTNAVYADLRVIQPSLRGEASEVVERMIEEDRLASYETVDGIAAALHRLSARFVARRGRSFDIASAVRDLVDQHVELASDFASFFPELQRFLHES